MKQSEKWHADRQKGLGGSDIAAALGVSPWKSQLELWGEKTGLAPSTFEGNQYTYWGSAIEPLLANRYMEDHRAENVSLDTNMASVTHKDHTWARANIDGLILNVKGKPDGIWEGKTASRRFEEVPVHYQLQVQHYMWVYDLDYAIISVLFSGNDYAEFRIERDSAYATEIVPQLVEFWERVEAKLPVFEPVSMSDMKILLDIDPVENVADLPNESGMLTLAWSIQDQTEKKDNAEAALKRLKAALMKEMKDEGFKTIRYDGKTLATIVSVGDSKVFDSRALQKDDATLYMKYMTKTRKGYAALRVAK